MKRRKYRPDDLDRPPAEHKGRPAWWLAARRASLAHGQVVVGGIQSEHRVLSDTELAELVGEVVKVLQQPRRKRAPDPTTKTARARKLAEELYPNGVGAVGEKNQKAIRSEFCDAYRERYGEGLSDAQAWKALFGQRG